MAFRETVHYNLVTASLYDWMHREADLKKYAADLKRAKQRTQRRLSVVGGEGEQGGGARDLGLANGFAEMGRHKVREGGRGGGRDSDSQRERVCVCACVRACFCGV